MSPKSPVDAAIAHLGRAEGLGAGSGLGQHIGERAGCFEGKGSEGRVVGRRVRSAWKGSAFVQAVAGRQTAARQNSPPRCSRVERGPDPTKKAPSTLEWGERAGTAPGGGAPSGQGQAAAWEERGPPCRLAGARSSASLPLPLPRRPAVACSSGLRAPFYTAARPCGAGSSATRALTASARRVYCSRQLYTCPDTRQYSRPSTHTIGTSIWCAARKWRCSSAAPSAVAGTRAGVSPAANALPSPPLPSAAAACCPAAAPGISKGPGSRTAAMPEVANRGTSALGTPYGGSLTPHRARSSPAAWHACGGGWRADGGTKGRGFITGIGLNCCPTTCHPHTLMCQGGAPSLGRRPPSAAALPRPPPSLLPLPPGCCTSAWLRRATSSTPPSQPIAARHAGAASHAEGSAVPAQRNSPRRPRPAPCEVTGGNRPGWRSRATHKKAQPFGVQLRGGGCGFWGGAGIGSKPSEVLQALRHTKMRAQGS
jgi:hypothetical protein